MAIWTWPPATITENAEHFSELISISDSGYEKRRMKSSRPLWSATYNYFSRSSVTRYEMTAFLRARSGPHEWFYLPSFMWDAEVSIQYTSGTTLTVNDNSRILDAYAYGRTYIWLCNNSGQNEVATISSSSGSTIIYISESLAYSYEVGCEVDVCYKARLNELTYEFMDNSYYKHDLSIPFKEVR